MPAKQDQEDEPNKIDQIVRIPVPATEHEA